MLEIRHDRMDDNQATSSAYDDIYLDEGLLQRDSYYLWLIGLLKPTPGKTILDISCGQGRLVTLAGKHKLHGIGLDFSIEGVRFGRDRDETSSWSVGDGEKLPLRTASLDYITHIGSLEHYIHPEMGAREIARVLKQDGKACILLPNAFGLLGNIRYVHRKGDIFDDGQPLQRYATRNVWTSLLTRAGLSVDKTIGYGEIDFPRTKKDLIWLIKRPQKFIRYGLSLLTPLNLANHFVFICTKRG